MCTLAWFVPTSRSRLASIRKPSTSNFERELLHGHEIMRQRLYAMVLESALEGKKAAMRLLAQMNDEDASSRRRRAASKPRPHA
jgi:hypothetical protein